MIGLALKPWDVYNNWKKKHVDKWLNNQNPIVSIILWSKDLINKIYLNYVNSKQNINIRKKGNEGWHWMLNKPIVIVETNNHIRAFIVSKYLLLWQLRHKQLFRHWWIKCSVYAFVIGNPRNGKKLNVFRVENLEIYEHDFETQKEELALNTTLWNIS